MLNERHTFRDIATAFDVLRRHNHTKYANFVSTMVYFEKLQNIAGCLI